jgi:spermidine dehydrogenase
MLGLTSDEKKARLTKTSYRDFLKDYVKVDPQIITYFQTRTHSLFGVGIEAVPALDCWGLRYPGFQGLNLEKSPYPGMSLTTVPRGKPGEPYIFHFPDGCGTIPRLLVRAMIPASAPGKTMEDIVTARLDYARLDEDGLPVRIRLNSTVVRARHLGDRSSAKEVEVIYIRGGKPQRVRSKTCVLACWNSVIPHLCPEISDKQKEALVYGVKVPLVYTNVMIRNWTSFQKLGISNVTCPGGFHLGFGLDFPVSMGDYQFSRTPEDPMVLHMTKTPCSPGLSAREQYRAGREELLVMEFETFEREIRDQLGRALSTGGFDPARDIEGITVNRWPHGYAYEYNSLYDPNWPEEEQPCVVGRKAFGRISIANSDAAAFAYVDPAIDQAYRAVQEVLQKS